MNVSMNTNMNVLPRRGRPPTSSIEQRIQEGMASNSQLKCEMCHRVFPRPKSLRAHLYCHTGLTPYVCDYPGCDKSFRQSGHLRSHTFRHTGEKPFRCPTAGCSERFLHANRHCSIHDPLKIMKVERDGYEYIDVKQSNLTEEQRQWLQKYKEKKHNPRGTKRPAENDSDEENTIPDISKRYEDDGYNSAGSELPSSSPIYKEEDISFAGSSDSSSSYCGLDESGIAAAVTLVMFKNRSFNISMDGLLLNRTAATHCTKLK